MINKICKIMLREEILNTMPGVKKVILVMRTGVSTGVSYHNIKISQKGDSCFVQDINEGDSYTDIIEKIRATLLMKYLKGRYAQS